jgi:hypothetical protein
MTRSAYDLDPTPADPLAWRLSAACSPATAELFWPVSAGRISLSAAPTRAALALCERCPVLADCAAYESAHPTGFAHIAAGRLWAR